MTNNNRVTSRQDTVTGATVATRAIALEGDEMDLRQAAAYLGVHFNTVRVLVIGGDIPATTRARRGRDSIVLRRADLARYLADRLTADARADLADLLGKSA